MKPVDFLYKIWSRVSEEGDYVFLSVKSDRWEDFAFQFDPSLKMRIRDFLRQNNPEEVDIYFCPLPFRENQRLAKYVKPVDILWSDVDDGDPSKLEPSVLWESSPGRHHALWFLKEKIHAEDAAELNRSLTYYLGADKGGWDLSQVLRVPGTRNHKYKSAPVVKLLHWNNKNYNHRTLARKLGHTTVKSPKASNNISDFSKRIPQKLLSLLNSEPEEGRRSDVLWYLENKLSDCGLGPEEILQVIKDSPWNKYSGRRDEDHRLKTELQKVIEGKIIPKEPSDDIDIETFADVMSNLQSSPGWTVPGFWMKRSHGIVAGEPKSFKSTLVMDLALSIATGKPFLNKFPIESPGKVLYIQNENAHWIMKDRFEKMLKHKGLVGGVKKKGSKLKITWPPEIPLYMINQQSFMLSDESDQKYLEELIKKLRPELVILDPLYLMFNGDVSSSQELHPVLSWLIDIKNTYKCGIILIHHYNKSGESKRGGQRMLGSVTLHGWIESAWYIASQEQELVLEREFRGAGFHNKLDLKVSMGEMGVCEYDVETNEHVEGVKQVSPFDDILGVLSSRGGISEKYLEKATGYNARVVRETLDEMIQKDLCYREAGKVYPRKET